MKRPLVTLILAGWMTGCAGPAPTPEHLGRRIAVMPINNRTGDPLVVSGDGLLDRHVFRTGIATVSEVLEDEAVFQLREKGFEIAESQAGQKLLAGRVPKNSADAAELAALAGLGPLCLYLEIRRWEPEGRAHVRFVNVALEASLVDVASRQLIWKHEHRGPIGTPGEFLLGAAYVAAAHKVIQDVLAPIVPPTAP